MIPPCTASHRWVETASTYELNCDACGVTASMPTDFTPATAHKARIAYRQTTTNGIETLKPSGQSFPSDFGELNAFQEIEIDLGD